jgi:Zinc knuckle
MTDKKNGEGSAKTPVQFVGIMEPYLLGEDFSAYLERFGNYLELNNVTDGVFKIRLLTNLMGPTASQKLNNACKPKAPKEFTYQQIVDKCKTIFCGVKYTIAEHYKFNNRHQHEGESATDYGIELQAMAENCKFGNFLDTALRDRFVAGLRDGHMKAKMLNEAKEMKFDEVVQLAVNIEMVAENVKIMESKGEVSSIRRGRFEGRLGRRPRSRSPERSYQHYKKKRATQENRRCYICRKIGHLASSCPEKSAKSRAKYPAERSESDRSRHKFRNRQESVNFLEDENINIGDLRLSDSDTSVNGIFLAFVNSSFSSQNKAKKETVLVQVAGRSIEMEWDTGSCVSLCPWDLYRKYFSHIALEETSLPLAVITGAKIQVRGQIEVEVRFEQVVARLFLVIADTGKNFTPLLGRDWLDALRPCWRDIFKVNAVDSHAKDKFIQGLHSKYAKLFDNDLQTPIKDFEVTFQLCDDSRPIFFKAYTLPFKVRPLVEQELERLCHDGIIEPVKTSEWASPIVVVPKGKNEMRMCVDFSVTLNKMIKTEHYPLPVIDEVLANLSGCNLFCVLDM